MASAFERSSFNLSGPPRWVPLGVQCRLIFGGFLNQFGWLFFGFGMIFFWAFAMNADLTGWLVYRGDLESVPGRITRSEKTSASEGGGEHSDGTPIYAHYYEFTAAGQEHQGVSYTTGSKYHQNDPVTIEYPKGNPTRSRIRGARTAVFGPFVIFVVIFPVIGFAFVLVGMLRGRKAVRLLNAGMTGLGKLKSKVATGSEVNNQRVYRLTFEFADQTGQLHEATAKTHLPHLLEDDAEEPLLYHPMKPSYAVLLDHLPGSPRIDEHGLIRTDKPSRAALVLFLPILSLVGHGAYAYFRYFAS